MIFYNDESCENCVYTLPDKKCSSHFRIGFQPEKEKVCMLWEEHEKTTKERLEEFLQTFI